MEIDAPEALCHTNMINNYYKPGPGTDSDLRFCRPTYVTEGNTAYGYGQWYLSGNYMEGISGGMNDNNWLGVKTDVVGDTSNIKSNNEFEVSPIITHTAYEALDSVLACAGATRPKRDTVDVRIIGETKGEIEIKGGGVLGAGSGLIDSQTAVGGWPVYNTPSEGDIPVDSDHDGMPDDWENSHDLNASDPEDGKIMAADGYSNLEHYLNSDIPYIPYVPSGLAESQLNHISVYPNPATGFIHLPQNRPWKRAELYDLSGRLMLVSDPHEKIMNITGLPGGIYLLKIRVQDSNISYHKIIKL
jgi:hypothetical protein